MLGVACSIYMYLGILCRDFTILGVLAWASIGIGIKNQADEMIWNMGLIVCVLCVATLLGRNFLNRGSNQHLLNKQ